MFLNDIIYFLWLFLTACFLFGLLVSTKSYLISKINQLWLKNDGSYILIFARVFLLKLKTLYYFLLYIACLANFWFTVPPNLSINRNKPLTRAVLSQRYIIGLNCNSNNPQHYKFHMDVLHSVYNIVTTLRFNARKWYAIGFWSWGETNKQPRSINTNLQTQKEFD